MKFMDTKNKAISEITQYCLDFWHSFTAKLEFAADFYDLCIKHGVAQHLSMEDISKAYLEVETISSEDPLIMVQQLTDYLLTTNSIVLLKKELRHYLYNRMMECLALMTCCNGGCGKICLCLGKRFDACFPPFKYDAYRIHGNSFLLANDLCGTLVRRACLMLNDIDKYLPSYQDCLIASKTSLLCMLIEYKIFFTVTFNGQTPTIIVESNQERLHVEDLKSRFLSYDYV